MKISQIAPKVNAAAKEIVGLENITVKDNTDLVVLGKTLDSLNQKDNFFGKLFDKIAKTVINVKLKEAQKIGIYKDEVDFGSIIEMIEDVNFITATDNNGYSLETGDTPDLSIVKPDISVQTFELIKGLFQLKYSLPDEGQMASAFLSFDEMNKVLSAVAIAVDNEFELYMESLERLTISNFIAEKVDYQKHVDAQEAGFNGVHNVKLLTLAKNAGVVDVGVDADDALLNPDFLRFSAATILRYVDKLKEMSVVFNTKGYKKYVADEDMKLLVISQYAQNLKTYLQSSTYHQTLVGMGDKYQTVNFWQSVGKTFDDLTCRSIDIKVADGDEVNVQVLGAVYDTRAAACCNYQPYTKAFVDPDNDCTTYWFKSRSSWINNMGMPGVVFTLD